MCFCVALWVVPFPVPVACCFVSVFYCSSPHVWLSSCSYFVFVLRVLVCLAPYLCSRFLCFCRVFISCLCHHVAFDLVFFILSCFGFTNSCLLYKFVRFMCYVPFVFGHFNIVRCLFRRFCFRCCVYRCPIVMCSSLLYVYRVIVGSVCAHAFSFF